MNVFIKANKIHILLLSLLALGLLPACSGASPAESPTEKPLVPPDRVDVIYFYDAKACACNAVMAAQIQSTLFLNFSEELTNGKLTFRHFEINSENNTVIANKYGATTTQLSLFIDVIRGETVNTIAVPEILLVKDNEEALDEMINTRIRKYLNGEE